MLKNPPQTDLKRQSGLRLNCVREVYYEARKMNQEYFATCLGVQRTALANWESGVAMPNILAMVRLDEWLGIPLEWIYVGRTRYVVQDLVHRLQLRALEIGALPEIEIAPELKT